MTGIYKKAEEFWVDEKGSVVLLLLFSISIVFGSLALSFEAVRYFAVQSRMEAAVQVSALFAAENRSLFPDDKISQFSQQLAKLKIEENPMPSFEGDHVQLVQHDLDFSDDFRTATVFLQSQLPTTFMRALNFGDNLQVSQSATALAGIDNLEIVFVVDQSSGAEASGKRDDIIAATKIFSDLVQSARSVNDDSVKMAFVPFGSAFTNISPHKDWIAQTAWPTEIPPAVPGTVSWTGALEDQRWCAGKRGAEISKDTLPLDQKFPLILDMGIHPGDIPENDVYFIATSDECSVTPIRPLKADATDLQAYLDNFTIAGQAASGTAMVWAERMLSPDWQAAWGAQSDDIADYAAAVKKVVILITSNANQGASGEDQILIDSCQWLKERGVTTYIADYGSPAVMGEILRSCASSDRHYFSVSQSNSLIGAMKDIFKSLLIVKILTMN